MSNDILSPATDTADHTPPVEVYSSAWCPYCQMAKRLLDKKGVPYTEHSVDGAPDVRARMQARTGRHTVPQIFIGERHVGGCDDLMELEFDGELDALLSGRDG
jgi:glutaredoxin 3